ncbi:MAG: ATP-binding cassette domain-containing protein, partial [Bacillota bacterium]|nr:ATP-binding cassette domain-containing protein [Bacillota bacterium]
MTILEVKQIYKKFGSTRVLQDINFSLQKGEALAIIGSSGSGKTTLLRCLNFLETPDAGQIWVKDKCVFDAESPEPQNEEELRRKRLHFGLVFQSFNLFPQYTALQNVMLAPQLLAKGKHRDKQKYHMILEKVEEEARDRLEQVGLSNRLHSYPHQLSGGQQQRVAIARALVLRPD